MRRHGDVLTHARYEGGDISTQSTPRSLRGRRPPDAVDSSPPPPPITPPPPTSTPPGALRQKGHRRAFPGPLGPRNQQPLCGPTPHTGGTRGMNNRKTPRLNPSPMS